MSRSLTTKAKDLIKRIREVYTPEAWLQIYYPLYYIAKAIRHNVEDGSRRSEETRSFLIAVAIALLLLWILWLNIRFLMRKLFKRMVARLLLSTEADDRIKEEFASSQLRSSVSTQIPDRHLETDLDRGLDSNEVTRRRKLYGRHEIYISPGWLHAVRDLSVHGVSVPLEISTVLAWVLQNWLDAIVLTALLTWHVGNSLYAVREGRDVQATLVGDIRVTATVTRESTSMKISGAELVPGDIVHLSEGEVVPADLRILDISEGIAVDQSAITGDPVSVNKSIGDTVYYTTGVKQGYATGIVLGTAKNTFIGRTVAMVSGSEPASTSATRRDDTPYYVTEYRRVLQGVASITMVTMLLALSLAVTIPDRVNFRAFLELALATAIINLPTGRETVIQSLRASGAARLSQMQAIINGQIIVTEALAGIDFMCTDKTGTLTTNALTMGEPYCADCSTEELLTIAAFGLPADVETAFEDLDPIDQVFAKALQAEPGAMENWKQYKLVESRPFDPETKMMTAVVDSPDGTRILSARGAPKAIFDLCRRENPDIERVKDGYVAAVAEFLDKGYRALGIARKPGHTGSKWELLGLTPMFDATRDETPSTIKLAKSLGIAIKVITGDAKVVAKTAAESFGLEEESEPFFAGALREYLDENEHRQPESDIVEKASKACIFAETFPEDKEAIVKFFRAQGHRVAVTGDGVRDQLALSEADCGIAVQGASEAAQSSADIVFLAPGIGRIVEAMQVSRQVLHQVQTYFTYRTAIGLHLMFLVCWSYIVHRTSAADLRWLMVNLHISDIIGTQLSEDDSGRTPFAKTPARWRTVRMLLTILAVAAMQIAGMMLTIQITPDASDKNGITLSQQTAFLGAILTDHWLCLLILTNGRFWKFINHWKSSSMLLAMEIPTRLSYFGWSGAGGVINAAVATRIWLVGLGTLCACGVVCRYAGREELVYDQIQLGGDPGEKSQEEGPPNEESVASDVST